MSMVYHHPKYYELAFSFRDITGEVDVFETLIAQYSQIPVSRVLELACGPAPHLKELVRRGYTYVGLDLSRPMLAYAQEQAKAMPSVASFHLANMLDFELAAPVDFAFLLLGSLYARTTADVVSHFDAVGRALKSGGLYLMEWCVQFAPHHARTESWEMSNDGMMVKTTFTVNPIDPVEQLVEEVITQDVEEAGTKTRFQEILQRRDIYPQEFLQLIAHRQDFAFVGWWNNWDVSQPLDGSQVINRPIIVVRRR